MKKRLSLAQLKRDANSGTMYLEMTEWFGKTGEEIKERLRGVRKVLGANTVSIKLLNNDGVESPLYLDHGATLVDYDGEHLTIYAIGKRKPTTEERALLNAWQQEQEEWKKKNPYSDTYWRRKAFFRDSAYPYMDSTDMIHGKKYLPWEDMVMDCKVRGEAIIKYNVIFDANKASA